MKSVSYHYTRLACALQSQKDMSGYSPRLLVSLVAVVACTSDPNGAFLDSLEQRTATVTCGKPKTVLYLNFDGATLKWGRDDATTNTSAVLDRELSPVDFPASPRAPNEKRETVDIVRQAYQRFNVEVVTTRPTSGRYTMVLIGGSEALILKKTANAAGRASQDCNNRNDANIGFAFSKNEPIYLAQVIVHEAAHTFGLKHVEDPTDAMNVNGISTRTPYFNDYPMPLQDAKTACDGTTTQNNVAVLTAILGPSGCTPPPGMDAGPAPDASLGSSPDETNVIEKSAQTRADSDAARGVGCSVAPLPEASGGAIWLSIALALCVLRVRRKRGQATFLEK